jgi:multidrug resistance efflux pump
MILFLTLIYVAVLVVLVKLKVLSWTLPVKLSPIVWMVVLLVVLFLPLQFYAPSGTVVVMQPTVQIVPAVDGLVEEIKVEHNQRVELDDVLFTIDPAKYRAIVARVQADLDLARIRLSQSRELLVRGSGRQIDVDRDTKQVESLSAQLESAQWDLDHTHVRSPGAGWVANVEALQEGARVVSFPVQQAMAIVKDKRRVIAQIHQIYLRHIEPGMPVEVTFKIFPGEVFTGKVESVIQGTAQGQVAPSGVLVMPREMQPGPFAVRLMLDDDAVAARLPAGAVGTAAIYSGKMAAIYIIRRVMIWMDAWMNYVVPA